MSYKTTVASSAIPLYEVNEGSGKDLVAGAAFKADHPHLPNILSTVYSGLGVRLGGAYKYAESTYTHGLPDGYKEDITSVSDTTLAYAMSVDLGYEVDIVTSDVDQADPLFFAEMYGINYWGFSYADQYLSAPPIKPIEGKQVTIVDAVFARTGDLIITLNNGDTNTEVYINDSNYRAQARSFYVHARFRPKNATTTNADYWIYRIGQGSYSTLDILEGRTEYSPFMPIIPLRESNLNLGPEIEDGEFKTDDKGGRIRPDTELYKTSVRLCKLLDADYDDLCRMINTNENVDDIDYAYLIFGINLNTETKVGKHYLYNFFDDLYTRYGSSAQNIKIKDSFYDVTIKYSGINKQTHTGQVSDTNIVFSGKDAQFSRNISDTQYVTYTVLGLEHRNYIYGSNRHTTTVENINDEDRKDDFIIPLSFTLYKSIPSVFDRDSLVRESFKIVCNSYERRKLKWYETDTFKHVMLVIATIATIYTGYDMYTTISAAYAAYGIQAAIVTAVSLLLTTYAVSTGVKWLVSQLPPEMRLVITVAMVALSIASMSTNLDIGGLDAETLLGMTNVINEGVTQSFQDDLLELQKDMKDFTEEANAAQEELDELWEDLDVSLDWFDEIFSNPTEVIQYETPDEFYTRTVHTGNIGVASLDVIPNYVDNVLALPRQREIII